MKVYCTCDSKNVSYLRSGEELLPIDPVKLLKTTNLKPKT